MNFTFSQRYRLSRGFTLVEMLVVIGMIGLIIGLLAPSLKDFGKGSSLQNAGNLVTNLTALARQTAMSHNTMTALVLLGKQGTADDYRAITIMEYSATAGWAQTGPWEILPTGIIVDFTAKDDAATFFTNSPKKFPFLTTASQTNPPMQYNKTQVGEDAFATRIFMPNGGLRNAQDPCRLRITEGFLQGNEISYTRRPAGTSTPANYYDIAIVGTTGGTKTSRP